MANKPNVTWEVPSNHQLLLPLLEPQDSVVMHPYPNAEEVIYILWMRRATLISHRDVVA
jgi:hypothetical protein